jgi:hypothetical protein
VADFQALAPRGGARRRKSLIFNALRHRSLSRMSSIFSHAASRIFARSSRPRRDAASARRLKNSDKRNKFFRAIIFSVIVFDFDELPKRKPLLLQASK